MLKTEQDVMGVESVFRPTFVLMCGRLAAFAATFFIPILLARLFVPEEFGTYKQIFLIYVTVHALAQFGMSESLFYFLPTDPRNAGRYVLNAVLVLTGAGMVCLLLLIHQAPEVAALMNNEALAAYLPWLGAALVFMIASAPLEVTLIARKRYKWAAYVYASDLARAVFLLVPLLFWRDLKALLAGALLFAILRFGTSLYYFGREFSFHFRPDGLLLKHQLAYALPFALAVLVETAQINFHQFAVSHYFDAATFAVYTVGCLQLPLVAFVVSPAGNVMMVLMGESLREGKKRAVVALWHDTTRKLALIFLPMVALLFVTARDLIPFLFTEQYRASVPIFMIWTLAILLSIVQTDSVLRVFAANRFLFMLNLFRLFAVAVFFFILIGPLGLIGAVLATVLSLAAAKTLALVRIGTLLDVRGSQILPWKALGMITGAGLLACAGPLAVRLAMTSPAFVLLAASALSYAVLYYVFILLAGILTEAEKAWLHSRVRMLPPPVVAKQNHEIV